MTKDTKPLTRVELDYAAKRHGIMTTPGMSDRAVQEALAVKLNPDAFKDKVARASDGYVRAACELELAKAEKAAAPPPPAPPPKPTVASPPVPAQGAPLNGTGAPRWDAAPGIISAEKARDGLIRRMIRGVGE